MYAGLMSSEPIAPLKEDPTWAHRSSSETIAEFVTKQAMDVGAPTDPKLCEQQAAERYAVQTTATIAEGKGAAEGLAGGDNWRMILSTMAASGRFSSLLGSRKTAASGVGLAQSA